MSSQRLAESIGIDRNGLIIEGRRFPFWIATEEVEVRTSPDDIPSIRVTLIAENIFINPLLHVETDGDVQLVTLRDEEATDV